MTIKEARKNAGLTQLEMSTVLNIPKRTIENWEGGINKPAEWVEKFVIEKLLTLNNPKFRIHNSSISNYAEVCKMFSHDTSEWFDIDNCKHYTASDRYEWIESSDNASNGVDVSWAFHLSDVEIEYRAAEELYSLLLDEIDLADSDEWDSDCFKLIYEKFSF